MRKSGNKVRGYRRQRLLLLKIGGDQRIRINVRDTNPGTIYDQGKISVLTAERKDTIQSNVSD